MVIDFKQVRSSFQALMEESGFEAQSDNLTSEKLGDVLGLAAVTQGTIHSATTSLEDVPTSATVLNPLRTGWLDQVSIEALNDQLNERLVSQLPSGIVGKRLPTCSRSGSASGRDRVASPPYGFYAVARRWRYCNASAMCAVPITG